MSVELKVTTTTEFVSMDAAEEFLRNSGAFEPHQAVQLIDEGTLRIEVDDPNESVGSKTISDFSLKEI